MIPTAGHDAVICQIHRRSIVIIALTVLLFACFLFPAAGATPPSAMALYYDRGTGLLSISITHPTANPSTHYIREVTVSVNGNLLNDSHYTSQPDPDTFTYTYPVAAQPGDELKATATCNLIGSASRTLIVTNGSSSSPPKEPSATPASPLGLLPLAGGMITVLFFSARYRK
jgi:hypothetical protein